VTTTPSVAQDVRLRPEAVTEAVETPGVAQVTTTPSVAQDVRLRPEAVTEAMGEAEEGATAEGKSVALTLTGEKIKRGGKPRGS
jgi:hypothetical protein